MNQDERDNDATRSEDLTGEGEKHKWDYFEYLDKVDQELRAGRFASQSK